MSDAHGRSVPPMRAIDGLRERLAELADLAGLSGLAAWDQLVMMPGDGAPARAHQLGNARAATPRTRDRATRSAPGSRSSNGLASSTSSTRDIVRLARRDWERVSGAFPPSSPAESRARERRGTGALARRPEARRLRRFRARARAQRRARTRVRRMRRRRRPEPLRGAARRLRLRTAHAPTCDALFKALADGAAAARWSRRPPRATRAGLAACPVAAQQAAVEATLARLGVDHGELARGRLRASVHRLDRSPATRA